MKAKDIDAMIERLGGPEKAAKSLGRAMKATTQMALDEIENLRERQKTFQRNREKIIREMDGGSRRTTGQIV